MSHDGNLLTPVSNKKMPGFVANELSLANRLRNIRLLFVIS
jgi:hypothetical protein